MAGGLLVLLGGCGSDDSKPSAPVGGRGYFVEAREGEPFRHLVVEGTPYEMGWHQGRLLSEEIKGGRTDVDPDLRRALDVYLPQFRRLLPKAMLDEVGGIAAGAGVEVDALLSSEVARDVRRFGGGSTVTVIAAFAAAPGAVPAVAAAVDVASPFKAEAIGAGRELRTWPIPRPSDFVLVERHPIGGAPTLVLSLHGFLGGSAGISAAGLAIISCEDDSLPTERRSLRGLPFDAGVRWALESGTDAQSTFDALPRLVGNRVLVADATNHRIDALIGLSVVGLERSQSNDWVLRPAGEGEERERNKEAQDRRLGNYTSRPGAEDAVDLAAAGRDPRSTFPVLLWTKDGVEATDADGKTFVYRWSR